MFANCLKVQTKLSYACLALFFLFEFFHNSFFAKLHCTIVALLLHNNVYLVRIEEIDKQASLLGNSLKLLKRVTMEQSIPCTKFPN